MHTKNCYRRERGFKVSSLEYENLMFYQTKPVEKQNVYDHLFLEQ